MLEPHSVVIRVCCGRYQLPKMPSITGLSQVRLDDGTPPPAVAPPPEKPATPAAKPATPQKGGKAPVETGPVNKLLTEGVVFERLICGKKDVKSFIISNPGLLPIVWRLTNVDNLPPEFVVHPANGEIEARSEVKVKLMAMLI